MPSTKQSSDTQDNKESKVTSLNKESKLESAPIRRNITFAWGKASSIAARAKASSSLVKYGLDQIAWISHPVVSRVVAIGDPILAKVDNSISSAYGTFFSPSESLKKTSFVESAWFNKVDQIIGFQFFYNAAKTQYLLLFKKGGPVQREDFGVSLKSKLAHVWDDSLGVVADAFWEKARNIDLKAAETDHKDGGLKRTNSGIWAELKLQFQEVWESKIVATFQHRVLSPAASLYAVALDHYLSFDLAQRTVSIQEFLKGMKTRLGNSWNENLDKPLREFFISAQSSALGELRRLHRSLDSNHDGLVTIGDVIDISQKVVSPVIDLTTGIVSGTWRSFLQVSQNTFDFIVPSGSETSELLTSEDQKKAPITLKSVKNRISRRIWAKAFNGFGQIRKFSAERLKDIIHVDLIAYAEEVIDNSKNSAKPTYDQVQAKLNSTLLTVRNSLNEVKVISKDYLETAMKQTGLNHLTERAKAIDSRLRIKLYEAINRAKDLSLYGKDYLIYHQELSTLPLDTAQFLLHIPYLISVTSKTPTKNDFSVIKPKIEKLISALHDAFICLIFLEQKDRPILPPATLELDVKGQNKTSEPVTKKNSLQNEGSVGQKEENSLQNEGSVGQKEETNELVADADEEEDAVAEEEGEEEEDEEEVGKEQDS